MDASFPCKLGQRPRQDWSWQTCIENNLQELQALIVCYATKKVLLKREGHRWILPGRLYSLSEFPSAFKPILIIPDVGEVIGAALPLAFLRQAWRRVKIINTDKYRHELEKVVVLLECDDAHESESRDSHRKHGYQWISIREARVFHVEDEASVTIQEELNWVLKEAQPENRLSWQRPGWLASTSSWMTEQLLSKCDATLTEEIVQLRSSHLTVILQAQTTRGRFFLKCTSTLANDAAYTQTMSRVSPKFVTAPVAVDIKKQLMITADYGEILAPDSLPDAQTELLTKDYAQLQIAAIGKEEELIAAGMPDLRLPKLLEHIDRLAAYPRFKSLGNSERQRRMLSSFARTQSCSSWKYANYAPLNCQQL